MFSCKGIEIIFFEDQNEENNKGVDRNEYKGNSSKRVAQNEEILAEIREKKSKDGNFDPSFKGVAENEQIQAEIREKKSKDEILDLSSEGVAENEEIQAEITEKNSKDEILNLSSEGVAENEEIQAEITEMNSKDEILDLSSKRVAENEEIQAEITEKNSKDEILNLSSEGVAENEEIQAEISEKNSKDEIFDLSLACPSTSGSLQSLEASNNNTRIGYFRNGYLSSCYSHPFSHNLSYSLTLSSKEDSENSAEGISWSVFSRFRPVEAGDCALPGHPGGSSLALSCQLQVNKDNDVDRISSSDSNSYFILELPARPTGDSTVRESMDVGKALQLYQPERILGEIVSESVPLMAQIVQELPAKTIESTKEYLRSLITIPEKKDFLISLQNRLIGRSDLTVETLSACNKTQLQIFLAIKMGHTSFLSLKTNHLQATELIEIFSFERCRNIRCKSVLPADNCQCKICSSNKGFCSVCMCVVCFNFDHASNTCRWVGCDRCLHWCHAVCAIQRNFIKTGPSINGPSGTTEMQLHCLGCTHSSEIFGFVRDVYMHCAKDWSEETLIEELDYVRKFFDGSEDRKGKELHAITYGLHNKLEKKMISPSDACDFIFLFFKYTDGLSQFLSSSFPAYIPLADELSFNIISSSNGRKDIVTADHHQNNAKDPSNSGKTIGDECSAIKEI